MKHLAFLFATLSLFASHSAQAQPVIAHAASADRNGIQGSTLSGYHLVTLTGVSGQLMNADCAATTVTFELQAAENAGGVPSRAESVQAFLIHVDQYSSLYGNAPNSLRIRDANDYLCVARHPVRLADVPGTQVLVATVDRADSASVPAEALREARIGNNANVFDRPGGRYEFADLTAFSPSRPLVGVAKLTEDVPDDDGGMTDAVTTVGVDVSLAFLLDPLLGSNDTSKELTRLRIYLGTDASDPGNELFLGLSGSSLLYAATGSSIPIDVIPTLRIGPGGARGAINVAIDIGSVLKEAKGAFL